MEPMEPIEPMDLGELTEADLRAAARGDEAAFTRVFRCLQPRVLRYLRTLAPDVAEDLAAETWAQVVRGLRDFRGDVAGFRGWLFTIAHHRYVDHVRRLTRTPPQVEESRAASRPDDVDVEGEVEEMLSTERALRLIGRLSPEQAQVVLLRVVAGLDVRRTAEVLGKRPGAVRVLAHRGLARLARILDEEAGLTATQATSGPGAAGVTRRARPSVTGES